MIDQRARQCPPPVPARPGGGGHCVGPVVTLFVGCATLAVATAGSSSAATLNAVATPATRPTATSSGLGRFGHRVRPQPGDRPGLLGRLGHRRLPRVELPGQADRQHRSTHLQPGHRRIRRATGSTPRRRVLRSANTASDDRRDPGQPDPDLRVGSRRQRTQPAHGSPLHRQARAGSGRAAIACANSSGELTDNWNVQFTFTKSTSDPNGFTWSAVPGPEGDTFAAITSADSATFAEGASDSFTPDRQGNAHPDHHRVAAPCPPGSPSPGAS